MLQEGMETNDTANIAWEILPAYGGRKIGIWTFSIKFDNVISVVKICCWIFMGELSTEELWQALHLNLMNSIYIEPCRATRYYKCGLRVFLLHHLLHLFILISLCLSLVISSYDFAFEHFFLTLKIRLEFTLINFPVTRISSSPWPHWRRWQYLTLCISSRCLYEVVSPLTANNCCGFLNRLHGSCIVHGGASSTLCYLRRRLQREEVGSRVLFKHQNYRLGSLTLCASHL
jgi:hypothetical protein